MATIKVKGQITVVDLNDGKDGADGTDGQDGTSVTVTGTSVTYQSSASGTTTPTGQWQTTIPNVPQGQYLWTKTVVTYSDGTSTTSYSVARMGINGNNGTDGKDGKPGEDGKDGQDGTSVTITDTSVTYAVTKNATQPADSAFTSSTVPTLAKGDYLWTKTVITFSDGAQIKSYSVSRIGTDGENGEPGAAGEDGKTTYVHYAYANSADGYANFSLTYFTNAQYIGMYTDYVQADSADYKKYKWARLRGEDGADGTDGDKGDKGDKGDPGTPGKDGQDGTNGTDGKDAWGWAITPNTMTFATDDKGALPSPITGNTATVSVNRGGRDITPKIESVSGTNCTAAFQGGIITVTPKVQKIIIDGMARAIPYPSGYVTATVSATDGGDIIRFTARVDFTVAVSLQVATLDIKQDSITATVEEIGNDVNAMNGNINGLTQEVSRIDQKADNISLTVKRSAVTGRNMLRNSRMRRIVHNDTTNMGMCVTLTSGKEYTLSARGLINASLGARKLGISVYVYTPDWAYMHSVMFTGTEWDEKSVTFTAERSGQWNVYAVITNSQGTGVSAPPGGHGVIDWVQFEEGGTATPWQPREEDFIITNMPYVSQWTNAGTATNILMPDGSKGECAYFNNTGTDPKVLVYSPNQVSVEANRTYTLSFWAKGTGNINAMMAGGIYGSINSNGGVQYIENGWNTEVLTPEWRLYIFTFSTALSASENVYMELSAASEGWVYNPRLEYGSFATDGSMDNNLLATGIDIRQRKITATANNFVIQNNSGQTTFSVDADGNITGSGDASFNGDIHAGKGYFGGMLIKQKTVITDDNFLDYVEPDILTQYRLRFDKITPYMVFNLQQPHNFIIFLFAKREFYGSTIFMENIGTETIPLTGDTVGYWEWHAHPYSIGGTSPPLIKGGFISFQAICFASENGTEVHKWAYWQGTKAQDPHPDISTTSVETNEIDKEEVL